MRYSSAADRDTLTFKHLFCHISDFFYHFPNMIYWRTFQEKEVWSSTLNDKLCCLKFSRKKIHTHTDDIALTDLPQTVWSTLQCMIV